MKTTALYNLICEKCGKERIVGYQMNWQVQRGICKNVCNSCGKKGKPNLKNRGRTVSAEAKAKIGAYWRGKKRVPFSTEHRGKISFVLKGRILSQETKEKIGLAHRGEKNYQWIADRSKLKRTNKQGERRSSAYFEWRKQVWLRDNFKCKIANADCAGRIETHHILSWSEHVELRYEINNGITLCHAHHPRKRAEEKRLSPYFQDLVSVSK